MQGSSDSSADHDPTATVILVERAKKGDKEAWKQLTDRYYESWLSQYHGDLGTTLRRIYDTEDLVQSAVTDAFRDIADLRDESLFFVWVTAILRHKVALRYRQSRCQSALRNDGSAGDKDPLASVSEADSSDFTETYVRVLDTIIAAFPKRPKWMTAFVLRYLDGLEVRQIARRLAIPERTAFHWIASASRLLRQQLSVAERGTGPGVCESAK